MAYSSLPQRFLKGSKCLNYTIIILALSVLAGWEFDIEILKRPLHMKAMNPLSALNFLCFGISFWMLGFSAPGRLKSIFAYSLILFILFTGLAKLLAISGGPDLQVDTFLFADKIHNNTQDGVISLIPFNTALNFTMISIILLLTFTRGKRNKSIANFLTLIVLSVALFSIIVYGYQVKEFLQTLSYFTMAIHTAFGFVLVTMVIFSFNSDAGFSAIIFHPGSGGTIARILLPAAIVAPVGIGLLRLIFFQWNYQLSVELGESALIMAIILIFFILVLFVSRVIIKKDALRLDAEEKLIRFTKNLENEIKSRTDEILRRENRFRALIENSTDAILLTDEKLQMLYQSPGVERMTGISTEERRNNPGYRYAHPDDLPVIQQVVNESLEQPGKPISFQIRFLHKDGHPIWIEGFVTNLLHDESVKSLVFNYKNINERKEAEEKLAAREQRFRMLIENITDGIVMNDENSTLLYQSPSVERILGYTLEERLEKPVKNFVHPDNQNDFKLLYQSLAKNPGKSIPFQYQFRHKNGHYVWLEGRVTNLAHMPGVNAYIANYRDITERKESEAKIASNEQRFRILIENNADVISLTDRNLTVIYQSPQGETITGYTQEERASLDANDLLHPDDIGILSEEYPKLFTNPEKSIPFHYRFKHKLGHYIWLEGSLKNLLDDPTIGAIVVNFRDVSDRKLQEEKLADSEKRFRTLIENNFDCILLTNENSELLYQSPSVERITGFPPPEKIFISPLFNVHPADVGNARILNTRLRENPGVPIRFQLRFPRKNGEYMWAEGVSTNLLHDSRVNAIVTNFRDVTDQKISESEILKLNAELEARVEKRTIELQAANKELESFSYSVSHDLRAPLRIINGFSQILIDDYSERLDSSGQQLVDKIMRNAHKMGRLIDDLLDFSKLGRAKMRKSMTNMSSLVQEVLSDLEATGVSTSAQLRVGELKPCYCDSPLIKQVWVNLISNAMKYSGKKENPVIEIGMTSDSIPTYFVKDNGAGFDMTYIHKLFGVFQRLHKAQEFEGTGVGLAIVQRILLRHGGEVWAEAKENEGATFFFHIPE